MCPVCLHGSLEEITDIGFQKTTYTVAISIGRGPKGENAVLGAEGVRRLLLYGPALQNLDWRLVGQHIHGRLSTVAT